MYLSEEEAAQPTLSEALAAAQAEAEAARSAMALQEEALVAAAREVEAAQELVAAKGAEVSQLQLKLDAGRPNGQEADPMASPRRMSQQVHRRQLVHRLAAGWKKTLVVRDWGTDNRRAGLGQWCGDHRCRGRAGLCIRAGQVN